MLFLRRLRAAAVLGLMWALLCAPFGVAMELGLAAWVVGFPLSGRDLRGLAWTGLVLGAAWGLASGLVFAAALAALERRGGVEHLARRRVLAWGALSGATFPIAVIAVTARSVTVLLADIVPFLVAVASGAAYGALVGGWLLRAALGPKRIDSA